MTKLTEIKGLSPTYGAKLLAARVPTLEALLDKGATPQGRQEILDKTGIHRDLLLKWVNRADLFRIKGVGRQYADLLESAGVDTVPELAQRNPDNLHAKLKEVNTEHQLVSNVPSLNQVHAWVQQAQVLPRVVEY